MQSSTLFADQLTHRHETGQLEAAVQKVLSRILRTGGGDEISLKKIVMDKLQQLRDAAKPAASEAEDALLAGISRKVSERLVSPEVQEELRAERRRKADTLNFGSTRLTNLLESLNLGRIRNPGSQPLA